MYIWYIKSVNVLSLMSTNFDYNYHDGYKHLKKEIMVKE